MEGLNERLDQKPLGKHILDNAIGEFIFRDLIVPKDLFSLRITADCCHNTMAINWVNRKIPAMCVG